MVSLARLLLQCNQLRDLIKEQHRLALLDLEPSHQERDDLTSLLDSIRPGLSRLDGVEAEQVHKDYEGLLAELEEIDFDTKDYRIEKPTAATEHVAADELRPSLPSVKPAEPQLSPGALAGKKTVRFSDVNEERYDEPYSDYPAERTNSQIYDMNDQLMLDQDRRLDQLGHSVHKQHAMSLDIDGEVTSQVSYLDDLEAQTDRSQSRLNTARHRVDVFNRKSREFGPCTTIFALVLILFILLVIL